MDLIHLKEIVDKAVADEGSNARFIDVLLQRPDIGSYAVGAPVDKAGVIRASGTAFVLTAARTD
jgi:hypothetical protein